MASVLSLLDTETFVEILRWMKIYIFVICNTYSSLLSHNICLLTLHHALKFFHNLFRKYGIIPSIRDLFLPTFVVSTIEKVLTNKSNSNKVNSSVVID
jgi:hypothetical protein